MMTPMERALRLAAQTREVNGGFLRWPGVHEIAAAISADRKATTPAKAAAARKNGKKGGRPRKRKVPAAKERT